MEEKHSKLSIASFVISLVTGFVLFILIAIAGVLENATPGGMDEESAGAILLGLGIIFSMLVSFVSLGLGIAGLVQKNTKKVFGILGIIFSVGIVILVISLMILGSMVG